MKFLSHKGWLEYDKLYPNARRPFESEEYYLQRIRVNMYLKHVQAWSEGRLHIYTLMCSVFFDYDFF